ncbi:MAG: DUF3617 family protein [Burkholderiaceae bacterium]|nr:DUF3617 family protein [Burkholderiaceae bacterium]
MKTFPLTIALAAAVVAGGAMAQNRTDLGDAPRLRAGYWETTSIQEDRNGKETTKISMCIDDATQEKMTVFSGGGMCSETSITPQGGNRWTVRSVCNPAGMGRMVSEGTISGDMRTRYHSDMVTTGSMMGQSMNERTIQEARHVGACPDGIVPGDMVMEDGTKINMNQMMGSVGGGGGEGGGGIFDQLGGLLQGGAQGGSAGQSQGGQAPAPSKGQSEESNDLLKNLGGAFGKLFGK